MPPTRSDQPRLVRRVALVGASPKEGTVGNGMIVAATIGAPVAEIVLVNPNYPEIGDRKVYPSLREAPGPIDMATVYVQPEIACRLLDEFEKKAIPEIWVNPGAESDELLADARRRRLNVIAACSIIAIGRSPSQF